MPDRLSPGAFAVRVLIVLGLVVLLLTLWQLRDVLLLVFGAVVVAAILDAGARPIERLVLGHRSIAIVAVAILLVAALALLFGLFGVEITAQLTGLFGRLDEAWRALKGRLEGTPLSPLLPGGDGGSPLPSVGGLTGWLTGVMGSLVDSLINLLLLVFGGVYFALQPALYREGLLKLVPTEAARGKGREAMNAGGNALRLWLIAKLVSMTAIGLLAGLGTWALGLPTPLGIGVFAGLVSFIPLVGAVAGAVPALLLASAEGWSLVVWTGLLFFAIQQVEGQLILPLAQKYTVSLPPALTLFAIVAFGVLFGFVGVVFAAPLTVVSFVLVKALWVEAALGRETDVPGRNQP